jgi:DNA transformation protein
MAFDQSLVDWVAEALEPIGTVTFRKMMGGATLYLGGTIFAIAHDSELFFKADATSDAVWDEAGCGRFTMTAKDGKVDTMNYRRAPADVYDDADAMREWAALGVAAGLRAPKKPRKVR